ncbi:hypothetical protein Dimus_005670 [Dionaea muscipula]
MNRERSSTRDAGGWTAVLPKRHQRANSVKQGRYGKLITLFVEDLPVSMDQKAMYRMFTKFGVDNELRVKFADFRSSRQRAIWQEKKKMDIPGRVEVKSARA